MTGRWPANVILSPAMARALDKQSGNRKGFSGGGTKGAGFNTAYVGGEDKGDTLPATYYGDEGGASRFFLEAGYEPWELEWIYSVGLRPCGADTQ